MTPLLAALALQRVPGLGPRGQHALLAAVGGLEQLAGADDRVLIAAGLKGDQCQALRAMAAADCQADITWETKDNHHILTRESPAYPYAIAELDDAPLALWALGDLDLLDFPKVAIVGSRNPSTGGIENARAFARDFASSGLAVVSGMAAGIDSAAHRGALDADGLTIAVIGTGADRVYPASNRDLAHEIAERGLILSEFAVGTPPQANHFPRRNRVISALSAGVLVVEAAVRSGSLITARQAGEQGRAVMAIPGSIHNPMARGCHRLIRDGARLVESTQDVLEEIGPSIALRAPPVETHDEATQTTPHAPLATEDNLGHLTPAHRSLLEAMGHDPVTVDTLVERCGEPVAHVSSMLLMLELSGQVSRQPDGRFSRSMVDNGMIDA